MEGLGLALVTLGVVMYANRAGYLYFVVRPRAVLFLIGVGTITLWLSRAHATTASPIHSAAEASYCFRNGGQPTFANGEWDKCLLPSLGEKRSTIYLPVRDLGDAALCSLASGKVTMKNGDWDKCAIP